MKIKEGIIYKSLAAVIGLFFVATTTLSLIGVIKVFTEKEEIPVSEPYISKDTVIKGFTYVSNNVYELKTPNSQDRIDFNDYIQVDERSSWTVRSDDSNIGEIPNKVATLKEKENGFTIAFKDYEKDEVEIKFNVYRRPLYEVKFFLDGDTDVYSIQHIEEDSYVNLPIAPTKPGYVFVNWDYDFSNKISDDTNIHANWSLTEYNIVFILDGGLLINPTTTYNLNSENIQINNPTKTGYTFTGWSGTDLIGENNLYVIIPHGSIGIKTYTAHYKANSYNIVYNANGGTGELSEVATYDEKYILSSGENFAKEGYHLIGWDSDNNGTKDYELNQIINKYNLVTGLNLKAVWSANTYTITYNNNGGVGSITSQTFTYNQSHTLSNGNSFTKIGYELIGWDSNSNGTVDYVLNYYFDSYVLTEGLNLKAVWSARKYTVSYNLDGGSPSIANAEATYDQAFTLPTESGLSKTGHKLISWKKGSETFTPGQTISQFKYTENVTFVAVWQTKTYTITYDNNLGTGDIIPLSINYNETKTISNGSNFKKDGYTISGWDSDNNGTKDFNLGQSLTYAFDFDMTLKAVWTPITLTINYSNNGGTGTISPQSFPYNQSVMLSNGSLFSKVGYNLAGWDANGDGVKDYNLEAVIPANTILTNLNLTAVWVSKSFNISYNPNTGSGVIPDQNVLYTNSVILSNGTEFEKAGYTLIGWDAQSDNIVDYALGQTLNPYTVTSHLLLKAVWSKSFAITYSANSGEGEISTQYGTYHTSTTLSNGDGFSKTGYHLIGWDVSGDNIPDYSLSEVIPALTLTSDLTLKAIWQANEYTITYNANGGVGTISSQSATYNESVTLNNGNSFTRVGYVLIGWDADANGSVDYALSYEFTPYNLTNGLNLKAVWEANEYTITYDANLGVGTISPQIATYNQEVVLSGGSNFTREGYTLIGWDADANGTVDYELGYEFSLYNLPSGLTLKAVWQANQYTITYDANEGVGTILPQTATYDEAIVLSSGDGITREGYVLIGWDADGNGTVDYELGYEFTPYDLLTGLTLRAVWEVE